ncbi:MAG: ATPase [Clostridiales bacterium]|jgi:V/A-type H+-transporting ATPase subunit I|nr:ATPase [Clostridiales bacterium]
MVEKMMYVNIMGHIRDLDWVIEKYVANYDVQLERASSKLAEKAGLTPLVTANPYQEAAKSSERILANPEFTFKGKSRMPGEEATSILETLKKSQQEYSEKRAALMEKSARLEEGIATFAPFSALRFDVADILEFNLISLNFGKMPLSNNKQLEAFLYVDPEILFLEASRSKEHVWGVYATPRLLKEKVDQIFDSLHFEHISLPSEFGGKPLKGSPSDVMQALKVELDEVKSEIDSLKGKDEPRSKEERARIAEAATKIIDLYNIHEAKKFAAKTPKDYFMFVGWMSEKDSAAFQKEVAFDDKVIFLSDTQEGSQAPPTKLKNPPVVRFFEFFTRMYGLPSYGEIDPTLFMAITYTLLFGFMFGDIGQGAVIALLGTLLYKAKGMALGAVMGVIGVSSIFFGFLYGSVFGREDLIEAAWMRPSEDIMDTLTIAVVIGVFLILCAMGFNIANAIKQKQWPKLIFSPNGLPGLVFYIVVAGAVGLVFLKQSTLHVALLVGVLAVPLALVALREPLSRLLERKKLELEGGAGMFVLETVIGLFEVLLTYFTNTVSFVRVGAFALSHAGMMGVVMLLAKTASGQDNIVVLVLGNVLVIALEGLVVGIQVLRLQFYEMFSRFFEGDGREFISYRSAKPLKR